MFVVVRTDHSPRTGDTYQAFGPYDEKRGLHMIECCANILTFAGLKVVQETHAVYASIVTVTLVEVRHADSDICEGL